MCFSFSRDKKKNNLATWRHQVTAKVLQLICCGLGLLTQPRIFITLLSPKFPGIKKIKAEHIRLSLKTIRSREWCYLGGLWDI